MTSSYALLRKILLALSSPVILLGTYPQEEEQIGDYFTNYRTVALISHASKLLLLLLLSRFSRVRLCVTP